LSLPVTLPTALRRDPPLSTLLSWSVP
jgi:hypothetical protein